METFSKTTKVSARHLNYIIVKRLGFDASEMLHSMLMEAVEYYLDEVEWFEADIIDYFKDFLKLYLADVDGEMFVVGPATAYEFATKYCGYSDLDTPIKKAYRYVCYKRGVVPCKSVLA
jgi:hypothetical protein